MPAVDSPPTPVHFEQSHFDLAASAEPGDKTDLDLNTQSAAPCATAAQDTVQETIVVCGKQPTNHYRLQNLASPVARTGGLGKAQVGVGDNAVIGVQTEAVSFGTVISNRVLITYKLKF